MSRSPLWPAAAVLILTACSPKLPVTKPNAPVVMAAPSPIEMVHTARYTLVNLTPEETLARPLRQIASHSIPAPMKKRKAPTRGEVLKIWLTGTGYRLCPPVTGDMHRLYSSPLPDSQHSPGPLRIETALKVIAGPAWTMTVDEITRTVCFAPVPLTQTLS